MLFSTAEITGILGSYLWPFFRIAAVLMAAPIFSSNFVNVRSRLMIAIALSIVIVPTIPDAVPSVEPLSSAGLLIIAHQILIGICMGFMLQLLVNAFIIAGQVVAMQMGLGFASMVDPQNGITIPVISQFYLIFVTLAFLSIDGHLILIRVLAESFTTLPIAPSGLVYTDFRDVAAQASWMYAAGVPYCLTGYRFTHYGELSFWNIIASGTSNQSFFYRIPNDDHSGFRYYLIHIAHCLLSYFNDDGRYARDD